MSPIPTFDPTDPRALARRAETYALAFEVAGQALADQERTFSELRGRAAGLVATAAVAMSLFGGPAFGHLRLGPALVVAVAAFAGVCLCVLDVLWPRHLPTVIDAGRLIPTYAEPQHVPLALVHRELALHRADGILHNRAALDRMTRSSRLALLLLAVEVISCVVTFTLTL